LEEHIATIFRVKRISELGTTLTITSKFNTHGDDIILLEDLHGVTFQKTAFSRCNIPEDGILQAFQNFP
jgi:hypothetical protein